MEATASQRETVSVEVRNGTSESGLASRIADDIKDREGFDVSTVGDAANQEYEQTVIFVLTQSESVRTRAKSS